MTPISFLKLRFIAVASTWHLHFIVTGVLPLQELNNHGPIPLMSKNRDLALLLADGGFTLNGLPLLEFDRRPIDRDLLRGFVLAWNADMTLVQPIDGHQFRLNGYAVLRNSDVRKWRTVRKEEFFAKAAKLNRLRPAPPANLTIASLTEAFSTAAAIFPLLTIHRERIKRGVCYVGRLLRVTQRCATILSISPQGEWDTEETYLLKDVTLLEFGGTYERLLALIAKKSAPPRN